MGGWSVERARVGYLANARSSAIHARASVSPVKVLGGVAGGMSEASDFFDSEVRAPMKELARSAGRHVPNVGG